MYYGKSGRRQLKWLHAETTTNNGISRGHNDKGSQNGDEAEMNLSLVNSCSCYENSLFYMEIFKISIINLLQR